MKINRSEVVRARIEPHLKENVEHILAQLGLNTSDAINMFFKMIDMHQGLPFQVKLPNKVTLKTFNDTDAGKNLNQTKDKVDLFKKLDI